MSFFLVTCSMHWKFNWDGTLSAISLIWINTLSLSLLSTETNPLTSLQGNRIAWNFKVKLPQYIEYIWTRNFCKKTLWAPIFFTPKIFWTPKYFLTPKFFSSQNIFLTQCLNPKIFWTQKFFDPQFFTPKKFQTQKHFDPKNFLTPNFFSHKRIFHSQKFFIRKNFLHKNFLA